jgi:hypothetical protein
MIANLREIDLDLELPLTVAELEQERDKIIGTIVKHLESERSRLGGDVYGLTFYYFGYVPLELVLSAAWHSENYEPLLWILTGVLTDLGIEGEYESIKRVIDVETVWLAEQSSRHDGNISTEDALKASLRLITRIISLWRAVEQLDAPVQFDQLPYYSVFISYSTTDEEFCQKLFAALDEAGIRAWFAPHDIKPGKQIHRQIYGPIERYDKLLLVLSEASMNSEWVGTELYKARQREQTEGVQMLFPIRLVPFERIKAWTTFDADSGRDLAREVREYFVPDFSAWRDEAAFRSGVDRLIEALMVEAPSANLQSDLQGNLGN